MARGIRAARSIALVVLTAGVAGACETGVFEPDGGVDLTRLSIHANVAATTIVGLSVEVTAPDIDPALIFNIPITDGVASGSVQVPAGSARLFTLRAFDAGGIETHRGSMAVDVTSGPNAPLEITLMPLQGDREIIATLGSIVVTISPAADTTTVGDSLQLTGVVLDSVGDPVPEALVAWATLAPGVAIVDSRGMVTGVATGDAWIVATYGQVGARSLIHVQAGLAVTRENNRFLLGGTQISFFGLRVVNALQSEAIANRLIGALDDMLAHGIQSISLNIQGGRHVQGGNSAFSGYDADGNLKQEYSDRLATILDAAAKKDVVVVLQMFYRGQDEVLTDANAVREAVRQTVEFVRPWRNVWFHVINEWYHSGYDHDILKTADGQRELYELVKGLDGDRVVFVSDASGANDGFDADTGTRTSDGDVVVEWVRADEYNDPGVFTDGERSQAVSDAQATFDAAGYWFFHAAWHQKADADGWPRFDKGGAGTSTDPGVSFAWNAMRDLAQP